MTDKVVVSELTVEQVENWLAEKIAFKLETEPAEISVDDFFDSFGLDSTEALVLANELESWLGFELETTALWYHPTIAQLAVYIVTEKDRLAAA
ncbi:acyl carrier protein [Nocardia sp. NPDC059240]|uniref:acyl carrier protein n=1 Tax=Nocardia sp. NPDC059240 TaxID=3346786 RepID=UPI0036C4AAA0